MRLFLSGAASGDRMRAETDAASGAESDQVAALRASDYGIAAAGRESGIFRASFMQTIVRSAAQGRAGPRFIET
jgi:hypothetical protein